MWRDAQTRDRERHWPAVERLLNALPPHLFDQAKLLEYDLALHYSQTGQFRDIFLGPEQFPLLSIGSWLIEDLSLQAGPKRERAERHLFLAAVLMAARGHTIKGISDETSFYDAEHLAFVQFLSERSLTELSRVVPSSSRFWELREAIAVSGLEASLGEQQLRRAPIPPDEPEAYLTARWSAPGKMLALAALAFGRRLEAVPSVSAMLRGLAEAFEIKSSLASMHADLLAGRPSYPIAVVARAAGMPLEPWPDATLVLGALVATNSLETILDAAIARVREGHRIALDLGLGTFAEYLTDVQAGFEASQPRHPHDARIKTRGASGSGGQPRRPAAPLITIAQPTMAKALGMAEGFLLSDLTFRESWEFHREGMFGSPAVASRFPAGLVLEILSAHGQDVSAQVDDFLAFTANNRFRYFDHLSSDIDTDTIGVFLRLAPYAASDSRNRPAATTVLACLERDVATSGRVPVWIVNCDGSPERRPFVLDLGEGCGTVVAHLLLGLLMYEPERYAETIERGSIQLLDRIVDVGLGANVNYPRAYALAAFGRLIGRLDDSGQVSGLGNEVKRAAGKARRALVDELDRAIARRVLTAQDAALLTIACLDLTCREKLDPRWTTTILKAQRFDGSWVGEPFAAAPNRGLAVTWYSSTLLTSALCYDALIRSG